LTWEDIDMEIFWHMEVLYLEIERFLTRGDFDIGKI
jgi:hypothetical protein